MEYLGMITCVDEPMNWVSSITYIQKANGKLCLCLNPMTSMRPSAMTITRHPLWRKLLMSLHTLASSLNWMPAMDTGQLSSTRTPAYLGLSTALSEDTVSCDSPLAWPVPKTSPRKRWIRSSKSAKDVLESQMTSPYMATPRQNMMPTYETLCILPAIMTRCSIHRKHM